MISKIAAAGLITDQAWLHDLGASGAGSLRILVKWLHFRGI
jgi:hypothetical protein